MNDSSKNINEKNSTTNTHGNIKVYIVHGYTSSAEAEWFPWLKTKLMDMGITVTVFNMPNPDSPNVEEWDAYLDENIKTYNENTFFIGHSLGCITLLRYINRQPINAKIGGVILASGSISPNPLYPNLDDFYIGDYSDMQRIIRIVDSRCLFSATNDTIVAYENSCELALLLNAKLITVENGGHFIGQEGFFEFPQLLNEFCEMIHK